MIRILIALVFFGLIELYAFQLIRVLAKDQWWRWLYLGISVMVILNVFLQFYLQPDRAIASVSRDWAVTMMLSFMAAKAVFILVLSVEDVVRLLTGVYRYFFASSEMDSSFLPSRRSFIAKTGLALAALPFGALLYGAWKGKFNYQVRHYALTFDDLPERFDGFRITQISDVHIGSFTNKEEVQYAINLTNQQESDVIVFTGDLVNNEARELDGWQEILGQLKAKEGVYSVLGNHDYGDYVPWDLPEQKIANLDDLKRRQRDMGWDLLLDEHRTFERDGEQLHLVGVQNYGGGRFPKYGKLDQAIEGTTPDSFKVLLSHDPSHWDLQVKEHPHHFHLTLSGHTHGMQFGFEIPGLLRWSPVSLVYKKWAGIYKEMGQFLNVNRGFGYIGYAGRAGIWPEISVITLKRAKSA